LIAKDARAFLEWKIGCDDRRSAFMTLAEYFEKRFRRQHGGLLDVDGTGVVGESGDGELVLWKSMSALECGSRLANFRSGRKLLGVR